MYSRNTWEYLSITRVFHKKKVYKKIEAQVKNDLFIKKIVYVAIGFTTFAENLPTGTGGALCPDCSSLIHVFFIRKKFIRK